MKVLHPFIVHQPSEDVRSLLRASIYEMRDLAFGERRYVAQLEDYSIHFFLVHPFAPTRR
jgi:hypothetical protein